MESRKSLKLKITNLRLVLKSFKSLEFTVAISNVLISHASTGKLINKKVSLFLLAF